MVKRFFLLILLFCSIQSNAQYYLTGVEPFGTQWRQIKTKKFSVIFPSDAEKIAIRYANLLSITDTVVPNSLLAKQKYFDVVVHNHSTLSNGFVAWAPKRMEIISQPPTSSYAQPWLTQLALHETRHTSQLFKINSGLVKPAFLLFGDQAVGLAAGFLPLWYLEGDAVSFETATTLTGRGRQADFYQYYRAHYLSNPSRFDYDKWLMGSFRDNIPSHYNLGYQLVSYAKIKYGDQVWSNTLRYVSRNPYTVFPFYFGLKKQSGLSRKELFKKTFSNLDSIWRKDLSENQPEKLVPIIAIGNDYADYRYPYRLNDSTLIAYKTSMSKTARFVTINLKTKKERTIVQTGYLTGKPSYVNSNIIWSEYKPHIRWNNKSYSIIKWFNAAGSKGKIVSDNGRYYSPVYNPKDNQIYVISGKDDGTSAIETFDFYGNKGRRIILPDNFQPFELLLSADGNDLYLGVIEDKGKSIVKVSSDGAITPVFGPTYYDIHSLTTSGNSIYFSTSYGYKEDVFALNITTKEIGKVTNSAFGSVDPYYSEKSNSIVFSNFTGKGYTLAEKSVDSTIKPVVFSLTNNDLISEKLSAIEKFNIDSISIPNNQFQIERLKGVKRHINIHSWAPFYYDPTALTNGEILIKPGVSVFSQNLTGTSLITAGYGYDQGSLARFKYQYFGLLPILSYELELDNQPSWIYQIPKTVLPSAIEQRKISTVNIYIPLTLSAGRFNSIFYPMVQLVNSNDYMFSTTDSLYHQGLTRLNYRAYLSVLKRRAERDIRPRFGFVFDLNIDKAPWNTDNLGTLNSGDIQLYLPGIGANHSILIGHRFQTKNSRNSIYQIILFSRGVM